MPKELMPDYLHLSPKGYAIWAEAIEAKLAAVVGDSPVKATAAASGSLTGEWVLTMAGPDGQPIDFPTTLQQDGATLTGRVARGQQAGKFLEIRDGKVEGNKVSWTIKRDREGGDAMVYQMTGTVEGGKLTGKTDTTMDGNPISTGWTAKRK
jgi:hypothetical protein